MSNFFSKWLPGWLIVFGFIITSFSYSNPLKGSWEYCGDEFNGKVEGAPTDYSLQRIYSSKKYESFLLEKGEKPRKYEAGDYSLSADTCIETQTFSEQESKLIGVGLRYIYSIRNDTLTLSGTLPNGNKIKEYWKRRVKSDR
ncbi:hypothetical protein [Mucilaginibacter xinganensis]|uniref:Lipocalin-like domain-containing protein n=1 Tax=Mucilaginibacter xinganensis TaxID=1234841 RepID=A0A223NXT6_9SPHI|nr:hypothetical protein [Mucilaginibacter xinganensis]ASU34636.1 hypothetical protein MuYL_2749 [Mucilaginibacter xinganensis]